MVLDLLNGSEYRPTGTHGGTTCNHFYLISTDGQKIANYINTTVIIITIM